MLSVGVGASSHPPPGPGAAPLSHSQANGVDILVGAGGALPPLPQLSTPSPFGATRVLRPDQVFLKLSAGGCLVVYGEALGACVVLPLPEKMVLTCACCLATLPGA